MRRLCQFLRELRSAGILAKGAKRQDKQAARPQHMETRAAQRTSSFGVHGARGVYEVAA